MQYPDKAPARSPRPAQLVGMRRIEQRFGTFDVFTQWVINRLSESQRLSRNRVVSLLRSAEQQGALALDDQPGGLIVYWHPQKMETLLNAH